MGPEFVTYKNVATYTESVSAIGAAPALALAVAPASMTPVKNLYLLQARVLATAQKNTGAALIDGFFKLLWEFPNPSAAGVETSSPSGFVGAAVLLGDMKEITILRSIPAGFAFEIIPTSNAAAISVPAAVVWSLTVEVTFFYVFLN